MDRKPRISPADVPTILPKDPIKKRVVLKKMTVSPKARKYIKNKIAGMNNYQAAVAAGYSKSMSKMAAVKIETLAVKKSMEEVLEKIGLGDEELALDLKEGLRGANKIQGTGDNFVEIPDYGVRHKYLETALKLKGRLQNEAKEQQSIEIVVVDYESNKDKSTS